MIAVFAKVVLTGILAAVIVSAATAQGRDKPIGDAIKDVPIFDAHIHYKEPAWATYPVKTVIEFMDRAGVAMALVSSTPDAGTIKLFEYAPKRIVPELRPYHGKAGSSNWTKSEGMLAYIKGRLAKYPHEGIGEFHVHKLDTSDKPLLREIAKLAKAGNIPVHIHSGAAPIKMFFELESSLKIIWAHAGMSEPAQVVGAMLDRYATLYADTSYREHDILADGATIDPEWLAVLLRHSDRFMVGTDTWVNAQWASYGELIALNRSWLKLLPREIAEKIAYKNAETLFKRKISMELIGKR
jgi:predicted TIM-barrel fold metal-dependent hydrolase